MGKKHYTKKKKIKIICSSKLIHMILFIIAIILSFMHMFIKFFRQNDNATLKAAINLQLKPCARLTEQNFHECTEPYDIALIETFTQNCGHCMSLLKEFDKAAHHLNIPLFHVNMDLQKDLIDKLGVTDIPTLLIHLVDF